MADAFRDFEAAIMAAGKAGDLKAVGELNQAMMQAMKLQNPGIDQPEPDKQAAGRMAAEGMGVGQTLRTAAGRGMDKIGAGLQQAAQLARTVPAPGVFQPPPGIKAAGEAGLERLASEQGEKDAYFAGLQRQRPVSSAIGEAIPSFLPFMGAPSVGVVGSALTAGAVDASKYGTAEDRLKRGLLATGGGLAGGLLGNAVGKLIAPVADDALSATQRTALGTMDNIGVKPRMSQVTGSPFMARVEDWAARTPGGAGVMRNFGNANAQAINRTAARGIGEVADELTPEVFASANARLGQVFESVKKLGGKPIQINARVGTVADDILRQQSKMLPTQQDEALTNLARQARALASNRGRIDGETYQLIRSGLSEASFDASGTNRNLYGRLLEALDDSADASLRSGGNVGLADAIRTARPQWGNLKTLERGAVAEGGNVSPARLASTMRTQNPAGFREGRLQGNPLYDIAQQGEAFKPLQAGSPTYERTLMSNPISTILGAMTSYPAARMATSPMMQAYPRALAMNPGAAQAAGLLAQSVNPGIRAGTMGLLNTAAGPMLFPIMAE